MPERKADGTKTAQSVNAIDSSAPPTSSIVRWAASNGDIPERILRSMFSTTTIASSTTIPTARTRPNRDRLFSDIPNIARTVKVPTSDTGIATTGMDRCARALQKQEHHRDDEEDCDEDGDDHLADRFRDEDRRVVDDYGVDAGRKIPLQLLHGRQNFMLDRKGVCAGLGVDH